MRHAIRPNLGCPGPPAGAAERDPPEFVKKTHAAAHRGKLFIAGGLAARAGITFLDFKNPAGGAGVPLVHLNGLPGVLGGDKFRKASPEAALPRAHGGEAKQIPGWNFVRRWWRR